MGINVGIMGIAIGHEMFFGEPDSEEEMEILEKVDLYSEEIIPRMRDHQFKFHFRMHPDTFDNLLQKLSVVTSRKCQSGNPELSFEKQVLLTIWYLANLESFRSVADRFGISKSSAWSAFYRTCLKLVRINRIFLIINWPSERQAISNMNMFRRKANFPGIVGLIDASHIPIKAPRNEQGSYINRKGFHSVLLQCVCDTSMKFIDCYAGEAGSIHDWMLFRRSDLSERLANLNFPQQGHLLGDAAYKLTCKIMVPFKDNGHLTRQQILYNKAHSASRVAIEQSFALLKGRFRRLKLLETIRVELIPLIIISTCILHNICILNKDVHQDYVNLENEVLEERVMNDEDYQNYPEEVAARMKRDRIARHL